MIGVHIRWGAKRFVFLLGPFALKLARVRILGALQRVIQWHRSAIVQGKVVEKLSAPKRDMVRHLFPGFGANLREYRLYRIADEYPLVPTYCTFFGLLNVQARGVSITQAELEVEHPFYFLSYDVREQLGLNLHEQYCRVKGSILLADYEKRLLWDFLQSRTARSASPELHKPSRYRAGLFIF